MNTTKFSLKEKILVLLTSLIAISVLTSNSLAKEKKHDPINKNVDLNKQVKFKRKFLKFRMFTQRTSHILDKEDQLIVFITENKTYFVSKKGQDYFTVYLIDFEKFLCMEIEKIWEKYQNTKNQ